MTALTLVPPTPTVDDGRGLAEAATNLVLILQTATTAGLPQPVDVVINADAEIELQVATRADLNPWALHCDAPVVTEEFIGAAFATITTALLGQVVRLYHVDTKRRCIHDA